VPVLLAALFTNTLSARLKAFGRLGRALRMLAEVVMIAMGVAMMAGYLFSFAFCSWKRFRCCLRSAEFNPWGSAVEEIVI